MTVIFQAKLFSSSFYNVRNCLIVNWVSFGFGLLVTQKNNIESILLTNHNVASQVFIICTAYDTPDPQTPESDKEKPLTGKQGQEPREEQKRRDTSPRTDMQ